jgi:hypothetical protein
LDSINDLAELDSIVKYKFFAISVKDLAYFVIWELWSSVLDSIVSINVVKKFETVNLMLLGQLIKQA